MVMVRELIFVFVDVQTAFDRVPKKMGYEEWTVRVVMLMYKGVSVQVRVNGDLNDEFSVNIGAHQSSILSPLLFIMVLDALSWDFRTGIQWGLLCADELVLAAESEMEAMEVKEKNKQK